MSLPVRPVALIALLDPVRDASKKTRRWLRWRPTVGLAALADLTIARVDILFDQMDASTAQRVAADIQSLAPGAFVEAHPLACGPTRKWDEAWESITDWVEQQPFSPDATPILVHTSRDVSPAALALCAHTSRGTIPGAFLIMDHPSDDPEGPTEVQVIDFTETTTIYEQPRITGERPPTRNPEMTALLDHVEKVAGRTDDPIVLYGPPGAGRTTVARWIHAIRSAAGRATGRCVEVDATEMGADARKVLFGGRNLSGAFSDAARGTLIIEHVGQLPHSVQVALGRRLDPKKAGPDSPCVVATLASPLHQVVASGALHGDLLAMLDGWIFDIPPMTRRTEDVEPAIDEALAEARADLGRDARFEDDARDVYVAFARSPDTKWAAGYRSLRASVRRMSTLADDGTITLVDVEGELERVSGKRAPDQARVGGDPEDLVALLGPDQYAALDRFDLVQLAEVVRVCRRAETLSDAGRTLFAASRLRRKTVNDADRVRKYLMRFGLSHEDIRK